MAGAKGRSGGARQGAGRPKNEPTVLQISGSYDDPEKFLRAVMNDGETDAKIRVDAAKALMPFTHERKGVQKSKEEEAKPTGRFTRRQPPKLVASGGKAQ